MAEYIKKKDALDSICVDNCEREYMGACTNCRMIQVIEGIPAADVAPVVHGRWEKSVVIQTNTSALYDYTCSECSIVTSRESNYCPNCGAHMKDGER